MNDGVCPIPKKNQNCLGLYPGEGTNRTQHTDDERLFDMTRNYSGMSVRLQHLAGQERYDLQRERGYQG
jgi:hypothetical protein